MGGLPCAKAVIDNRNALVQQLDCMVASIHLNSTVKQPTDRHLEQFKEAAERLAKVAAEIEEYVRT